MLGELGILNVGAGDTKLSFDKSKPAEVRRARKVVKEMLAKGFAILVQVEVRDGEPLYRRAKDFDEQTDEYIIVGEPGDDHEEAAAEAPAAPKATGSGEGVPVSPPAVEPRKAGPSSKLRRVPAGSTRAVGVSRSAGG